MVTYKPAMVFRDFSSLPVLQYNLEVLLLTDAKNQKKCCGSNDWYLLVKARAQFWGNPLENSPQLKLSPPYYFGFH